MQFNPSAWKLEKKTLESLCKAWPRLLSSNQRPLKLNHTQQRLWWILSAIIAVSVKIGEGLIVMRTRGIQLIIPALGVRIYTEHEGVTAFNRTSKPLNALLWKKLLSQFCHTLHLYLAENPWSYFNESQAPPSGPLTDKDVQVQRQLLVIYAGLEDQMSSFIVLCGLRLTGTILLVLKKTPARSRRLVFHCLLHDYYNYIKPSLPTVSPQTYCPSVVGGFAESQQLSCCHAWFVCLQDVHHYQASGL